MKYRYKPTQRGNNIWCTPESKIDQDRMLSELMKLGLEIVEKSEKQIPLWSNRVKIYRNKQKLNGGFTKGARLQSTYRTVFGKKTVKLQNSGEYGYEKVKKQSPLEIIAGECRKFQRVIADGEHLSPTQIGLWNQAIDQAINGSLKDKKGEEELCSLISIRKQMYQGPNWDTRDLPLLNQSEYMTLLNKLDSMYIEAVDTDKEKQQQKDQTVLENNTIFESIQ